MKTIGYTNCKNIDFSSTRCFFTDFTGANLKDCNFKKADISVSSFASVIFENCDFTNSKLKSVDFTNARLENCDFTKANLFYANFSNSTFKCVDLTEAKLNFCIGNGKEIRNYKNLHKYFIVYTKDIIAIDNAQFTHNKCFSLSKHEIIENINKSGWDSIKEDLKRTIDSTVWEE